jgi:hypothetical protein
VVASSRTGWGIADWRWIVYNECTASIDLVHSEDIEVERTWCKPQEVLDKYTMFRLKLALSTWIS